MANLVSPGYKRSKLINSILAPNVERTIEFKGLNRLSVIGEGEMSDMQNLTADNYPTLTPRAARGTYMMPPGAVEPYQIMERFERIAMIAKDTNGNVSFFYHLTKVSNVTGLTADTKMVAINNKICFFPQKTYVEIVRTGSVVSVGTFGSLEATQTLTSASVTVGTDAAVITLPSGHGFSYDDALSMSGTLSFTESGQLVPVQKTVDTAFIVDDAGSASISIAPEVITSYTGLNSTGISFTGTISRTMPVLDQVIEWNNRLWGASNVDNTIYACKLGDPKNWQYYQGTSMDSYYATQGSDEDWTGAAGYSNHLVFFKQNSMTKIYGTAPSNYQITNTKCYGVEAGSRDSVCVINNTVFYKSAIGIMVYEGADPVCISDGFNMKFKNVVGGTEGRKYYASIQKMDNTYELMCLNIDMGVWHKEDAVRFRSCCNMDGKLYFINSSQTSDFPKDKVYIINPDTASENENNIAWRAVFGPFDEWIEERKIYSKLALRFIKHTTASVSVYISINQGEWELVKTFSSAETGGEFIPIIPRRCDRYSIKIEGTGKCEIKSLTRRYRAGTEGKL